MTDTAIALLTALTEGIIAAVALLFAGAPLAIALPVIPATLVFTVLSILYVTA